jgi:predicted kinase
MSQAYVLIYLFGERSNSGEVELVEKGSEAARQVCVPVIQTLWRQEDPELESSLDYIVRHWSQKEKENGPQM